MSKLTFVKQPLGRYAVFNSKTHQELGMLAKNIWNRWTWEQRFEIVMSRNCLKELVEFMKQLGGKG